MSQYDTVAASVSQNVYSSSEEKSGIPPAMQQIAELREQMERLGRTVDELAVRLKGAEVRLG